MSLNFVREAHVKKYTRLMKLNLPAELESLWWVGAQFTNAYMERINTYGIHKALK